MHPKTLLFVLVVIVPVAVAAAGLVSFLLLRSGYGIVVGVLLPFVALLALVAALGASLGRAAGGGRRREEDSRGRDDDV